MKNLILLTFLSAGCCLGIDVIPPPMHLMLGDSSMLQRIRPTKAGPFSLDMLALGPWPTWGPEPGAATLPPWFQKRQTLSPSLSDQFRQKGKTTTAPRFECSISKHFWAFTNLSPCRYRQDKKNCKFFVMKKVSGDVCR